jgi:hypothetical protein
MQGSRDGRPHDQDDLSDILESDHQGSFQHPWRRQVPPPLHRQPNDASRLAREEEAALASDSLEETSKRNDHGRTESAKAFLHACAIKATGAVLIVFAAFFFIWAFHAVCPTWLEFVPTDKLANLNSIIQIGFGGVGGALFMKFLSKHGF